MDSGKTGEELEEIKMQVLQKSLSPFAWDEREKLKNLVSKKNKRNILKNKEVA